MTTSDLNLPPGTAVAPAPVRRRRRWPVVVSVVVAPLVVLVVASAFITLPYYALVPGDALAVGPLVSVPATQAHPLDGSVLLTDVGVDDVRLINWIPDVLDPNAELVKKQDLTGNLPQNEFDQQGVVDMTESELTAEAVALRQVGLSVPETDVGVTIYTVIPGTPAYGHLQVGDVVSAVDGSPVTNTSQLVAAIRTHRPGEVVTLTVGSIDHPQPGRPVKVTLGSATEEGKVVPILGIPAGPAPYQWGMGTQPRYDLPFPVSINPGQIGGPSAGLAFTLGLIDLLSGGHLTGGHVVAATGTIRPDGSVGDVGGVAQKTVAVERQHATLFLVPEAELAVARAHATKGLTVVGVSSLHDALAALQRAGGELGSAALGPPPGPGGHSLPADWQLAPWS